ncbi:hypothetical protein PENTCL1PPCAC_312, partial [Pristionchus entomophagus]
KLPQWDGKLGSLKCGEVMEDCYICSSLYRFHPGVPPMESCQSLDAVDKGLPAFPQSCIRKQDGDTDDVECVCNTKWQRISWVNCQMDSEKAHFLSTKLLITVKGDSS